MSAEEDAAYMQALTFLSQTRTVDLRRVLVLRTASDYTLPPPGQPASKLLKEEASSTGLSSFAESLSSAYETGSSVANELSRNWAIYRDHIPGTNLKPKN
jgi:purine nucleoside permease